MLDLPSYIKFIDTIKNIESNIILMNYNDIHTIIFIIQSFIYELFKETKITNEDIVIFIEDNSKLYKHLSHVCKQYTKPISLHSQYETTYNIYLFINFDFIENMNNFTKKSKYIFAGHSDDLINTFKIENDNHVSIVHIPTIETNIDIKSKNVYNFLETFTKINNPNTVAIIRINIKKIRNIINIYSNAYIYSKEIDKTKNIILITKYMKNFDVIFQKLNHLEIYTFGI
jgi:hypothetical protein